MNTFGEIVEPTSRSAWEDWDEINSNGNLTALKWQKDIEIAEKIETLLIFEGRYLSECIKMQSHHKLEQINSIPEVNLLLFKSKSSNTYLCIIKDYDVVQSSEIVELLKKHLAVSADVVAIQTKSLSEYHAPLSSQDCVIRSVYTTKSLTGSLDFHFPKLEQPNIISGVTAGVICLREYYNLPGVAVMCYIEHPEEYQIEEIQKLLEKLNILETAQSRPSSVLNSNLYI